MIIMKCNFHNLTSRNRTSYLTAFYSANIQYTVTIYIYPIIQVSLLYFYHRFHFSISSWCFQYVWYFFFLLVFVMDIEYFLRHIINAYILLILLTKVLAHFFQFINFPFMTIDWSVKDLGWEIDANSIDYSNLDSKSRVRFGSLGSEIGLNISSSISPSLILPHHLTTASDIFCNRLVFPDMFHVCILQVCIQCILFSINLHLHAYTICKFSMKNLLCILNILGKSTWSK